jgi:SAM-dependent methyltransferase
MNSLEITNSTNLKKHTSGNPILRALIKRFQERCAALIPHADITTVKELGCGEGFFLNFLSEKFPRIALAGSDISPEAIEYAKSLLPSADLAVESIYELPDADSSHDLIIASEVLEHLEEPEKALKELVRISRRYLLLTVPNEPAFQLTNFIRGKYLRSFGNHPEHIQHWSRQSFTEFVSRECNVIVSTASFPWIIIVAEKKPA